MHIHDYDAVVPFPGGLGRADFNASRLGTVITKHRHGRVFNSWLQKIVNLVWKGTRVFCFPKPFDLFFLIVNFGHIMSKVAGVTARSAVALRLTFLNVYDHRPSCTFDRLGISLCDKRVRNRSRNWDTSQNQSAS
jgi:hypothetical protein